MVVPVPKTINDLSAADRGFFAAASIPVSHDTWQRIGQAEFRLAPQRGCLRLWRKTFSPAFYGGIQIQTVVADSGLAREWVAAEASKLP